jgi:hypothetical protein
MGFTTRFVQMPLSFMDSLKDITSFPSQSTLWADKVVGGGSYIRDVPDFVFQVLQECAQKKDVIDVLRISGHGSNKHFRIGASVIDSVRLPGFAGELKKIVPVLNPRGIVVIENCHAGETGLLLGEFSKVLGGIVVSGREGLQNPLQAPQGTEWRVQDADSRLPNPNMA